MATTNLVLTAESILYPEVDCLFLGKWAIPYQHLSPDAIHAFEKSTVPYVYDKEDSAFHAYQYLQNVDQTIFPNLSKILNTYHGVSFSQNAWKILIGYWWREFIESLYERYQCLTEAAAITHSNKFSVKVLPEKYYITPYDARDFTLLISTDLFNHQLFSDIIKQKQLFHAKDLEEKEIQKINFSSPPILQQSWKDHVKFLFCLCSKWNNMYLISSYLPLFDLCKISLKHFSFPCIDTPRFLLSKTRKTKTTSRAVLSNLPYFDNFTHILTTLLPQYMPKVYWEDFSKLQKVTRKYFPNKPQKLLFTANAFAYNEGFKLFAANQIENHQTPFVIAQHGGNYGCAKWNSSEDFEIDISKYYITYGWKSSKSSTIIPFIVNRFKPKSTNHQINIHGDILWVLASFPKYAYTMYAVPIGPQFIDYLYLQANFLNALTPDVRSYLKCRAYRHHYGWNDIAFLEKITDLEIACSNIKESFYKQAAQSRLIVCTYNATTHLETLMHNIPTIIYWDPKHWALREEAKPIHQLLMQAGILYDSPEEAAKTISNIYKDTKRWWQDEKRQLARAAFCRQFANTHPSYSKVWQDLIKKLSCHALSDALSTIDS